MEAAAQITSGQYLTFMLDGELFAADVGKVREVLEPVAITHVPQTPEYMLGVINLRGSVVPVIDLREQFGMPRREITRHSCIVVVEVVVESDLLTIGLMADNVQEVVNIEKERINSAPRIGTRLHVDYLAGISQVGEAFVLILNLDKVLNSDEILLLPSPLAPAAHC